MQPAMGRPLTARSVIASTLLGTHPPRLPSAQLVRSGELFGITEGTTRTALSRMAAAGELHIEDGWYELTGPLLERQRRQDDSRKADRRRWDGSWEMAVVVPARRTAPARAALREAMRRLKRAELREGIWMRPDNLGADRSASDEELVHSQCTLFNAAPKGDPSRLVAGLWDLPAWSREARRLERELGRLLVPLQRGDSGRLREGFELSAAVLRHLLADPLLPTELLGSGWPGEELRDVYDLYDTAYKALLRRWFGVASGV